MVDSVKITGLQDIGANIAYTTLVPVVNMAGTPTTQKANLQILGNLILSSAGGPNFAPAAQAINAQTVSNAAQPSITSVGTLTSLAVSGNISTGNANLGNLVVANFFSGDGSLLTNISVSYSNNDVANYLPTYTGNVGANWIKADYIQGNALSLFNIPGSNVSGTVPYAAVANGVAVANVNGIGNIATINLNGNALSVLRGDGTWGEDANSTYGNSNVVSLLGSFGSNTITTTGVITGDGYGLSNVPYGSLTGTPSLGNISSINLTGSSSNVLYGNGEFAPITTGAGGTNTQIQFNANGVLSGSANLIWDSTYETLKTPKISIANAINSSASQIGITPGALPNGQGPTWTFDSTGGLYWPAAGGALWVIEPNPDGEFEFKSTSNIVISTDINNSNSHFTFDTNGVFTAPSNVNLLGTRLNVGAGSANLTGLNVPTLVIATNSNTFVQAAITNTDGNGSADFVSYGAGGNDSGGWSDLGFTGNAFSDVNYTITGPGDGYVFVQGYANVGGGNLVLATGDQGTTKDIVFSTGGFSSSNEFARIDHANSLLHLTRTGSGIKFQDGSIQNSAAVVWTTAPISNTSPGTPGQAAYDAGGNLFICVAANTWSKFSGTTSW